MNYVTTLLSKHPRFGCSVILMVKLNFDSKDQPCLTPATVMIVGTNYPNVKCDPSNLREVISEHHFKLWGVGKPSFLFGDLVIISNEVLFEEECK